MRCENWLVAEFIFLFPLTLTTAFSGYGFVEFEDRRDAEDALHDLDGKEYQHYSSENANVTIRCYSTW